MSKVINFDKANNKSKSRDIRKNTEYFIGLDIGTSSVGWAREFDTCNRRFTIQRLEKP